MPLTSSLDTLVLPIIDNLNLCEERKKCQEDFTAHVCIGTVDRKKYKENDPQSDAFSVRKRGKKESAPS